MSVYFKNGGWHFDFWFQGERQTSKKKLRTKDEASQA